MDKKFCFFFVAFMLIGMGGLFAQEERGYVKTTVSFGGKIASRSYYDWNMMGERIEKTKQLNLMTVAFDVDFVNFFGLTFGWQQASAFDDSFSEDGDFLSSFGFGYTYTADRWSVGAKFMVVPLVIGGVGLNVNGTWWVNKSVGLTGMLDYYSAIVGNNLDLAFRVGISAKI